MTEPKWLNCCQKTVVISFCTTRKKIKLRKNRMQWKLGGKSEKELGQDIMLQHMVSW